MSDSSAEWVTAIATCALAVVTAALAVGAIGAFIYAGRAYRAQNAQLKLARTPVLRGEVSSTGSGVATFHLDVWLSTPEPLASLRVIIEEARAHDCPLGFTPGQTGVEQYPDQDALPPGWRNDPLRPEARRAERLLPGRAATWQMALRQRDRGIDADPSKVRLRAECIAALGGEPWLVEVPVTMTEDAMRDFPIEPGAWTT